MRDGGREVIIGNPTDRRIVAMVLEQRLPFGSVWHGEDELVHVAEGRFVTVPPLAPGERATLRFEPQEYDELLLRHPSNKGLVILDARRDRRSNEIRVTVSVCRKQPLAVEGVDPEGVYEVQVDDEPAQQVGVRTVRTIQARLAEKTDAAAQPTRRTYTPGTTRFLDLEVEGEEDNFVERVIRVRQIPEPQASKVKAALMAGIPAKRGRVT